MPLKVAQTQQQCKQCQKMFHSFTRRDYCNTCEDAGADDKDAEIARLKAENAESSSVLLRGLIEHKRIITQLKAEKAELIAALQSLLEVGTPWSVENNRRRAAARAVLGKHKG